MITKETLKNIAYKNGADLCGIADQKSFCNAPQGFKPTDIYSKCKSVLVFAKRLSVETINAESCVPYAHLNAFIIKEVDRLTYKISLELQDKGVGNVIVPSDDPAEYWEAENLYARGVLSLRHAGQLAGLGYLGENTLLINKIFGNMIQLGALLLDIELEGDQIISDTCPENCKLCIENCPVKALDGVTINQKKCRIYSNYEITDRYFIKKCYLCRKICPRMRGYGGNL